MRYTISLGLRMRKNESLHVAIHTTTENKIGWGNPEYDIRLVFSETTGVICMELSGEELSKAKYQRKKSNNSLG